jgi:hypothetical protein
VAVQVLAGEAATRFRGTAFGLTRFGFGSAALDVRRPQCPRGPGDRDRRACRCCAGSPLARAARSARTRASVARSASFSLTWTTSSLTVPTTCPRAKIAHQSWPTVIPSRSAASAGVGPVGCLVTWSWTFRVPSEVSCLGAGVDPASGRLSWCRKPSGGGTRQSGFPVSG